MFIIQSGIVEITHTAEGDPFIIEKLYRGSIINHHSFLLNDDNDTDGKCATTVSAFALEYHDLEIIRNRISELDTEIKRIENHILEAENPIALDYIIKIPKEFRRKRDFKTEVKRNEVTVQLKNAVMQVWLKIKEQRQKPSMKDILKIAIQKKREAALRKQQGKSQKDEDREKRKNMKLQRK